MLVAIGRRVTRAREVVRFYQNWPLAFLCYFGLLRNREVIYTLRNGIRFMVRASDLEAVAAINDVWLRQIYTPLRDEIRSGYTIVDIGAHIGTFSVFASTCAEQVTVYSYEPSEEKFYFLIKNIRLNRLNNIKAFQLAVSRRGDKVKLYIDKTHSTLHSSTIPKRFYEEVNSTTLEEVLDNNRIETCDLLKMDCEGAEYEILFSAPKNTLMRIENISLEYHDMPTYHVDDLKEYLVNMGFEVWLGRTPILHATRRRV